MGSPCNTFGNEPTRREWPAAVGHSRHRPKAPSARLANCSARRSSGPRSRDRETGKVQGDRYQTKECESSSVDGCNATQRPDQRRVRRVRLRLRGEGRAGRGQPHHRPAALRPDVRQHGPDRARTCRRQRRTSPPARQHEPVRQQRRRDRYIRDSTTTASLHRRHFRDYCTGDSPAGHPNTDHVVRPAPADGQPGPEEAPGAVRHRRHPASSSTAAYRRPRRPPTSFKSNSSSYDERDRPGSSTTGRSLCTFTPTAVG